MASFRLTEKINQYFKTLLFAFLGRNPFRVEFQELNEKLDRAAYNLRRLQEMYCEVLEQMDEGEKQIKEINRCLLEASKRLDSYQKLVENLRTRITEKDMILEQTKKEYQKRIDAYNIEIDHLRNELLKYKREQAQ